MKVKFTYRTKGLLRLDSNLTFTINDTCYDLICTESRLSDITITYRVPPEQWPEVIEKPEPGIALSIRSRFAMAQPKQVAKNIADLLTLFGSKGLDPAYSKEEWLPDSTEEEAQLQMFGGTFEQTALSINEVDPIPLPLVWQAVASADQDHSEELDLAFYRIGLIAMEERRFIEAFYHFFFVLETNYADGKFKTNEVIPKLLSIAELTQDIKEELGGLPASLEGIARDVAEGVLKTYLGKNVEFVVKHLVGRRGFLHHHTRKDKGRWHPDKADDFKADTYFLQRIAYRSVWRVVQRRLWSPRVLQICSNLTFGTEETLKSP